MFNDDTQVDDLENTSEETTEAPAEDATDYKAEAAKWRAIAERNKEKIEKKEDAVSAPVNDDALLARLEARGVVDADIQNYLITSAKREGKHPVELLADPYFKDRVTAMKQTRETNDATPSPSSRTPESKKDLSYWIKEVEAGRSNSPDSAMRRKVREAFIAKAN